MEQTVLTSFQQKVLDQFKKTILAKKYYLTGGTALAEFYLHHRQSEDLDFFTQEELNLTELKNFIHAVSRKTKIDKTEFQHGFGLYTFFLHEAKTKSKHKIDFGQYPFEPIEKPKQFKGIFVDSLYDIAVNKAHTIAFRPRLRDFIDLYFILEDRKYSVPPWAEMKRSRKDTGPAPTLRRGREDVILEKEKSWNFKTLLNASFEKFEMKADVLQVGQNLLQVKVLKDIPVMIKKINLPAMQEFFLKETKALTKEVWKG